MTTEVLPSLKVPKTPKQCDRVGRILGAARQAFAEKSFHEVLVDDVARLAGVGKGTIYRYYPDKESLYFAVIFDGIDTLKRQIASVAPAQGHQETAIRDLIRELFTFFSQNHFFFRLMYIEDSKVGGEGKPNRQRWKQERGELIDAVAQMLERGREAGVLDAIYPRTSAQILFGMVRTILHSSEDQLTTQQMSDEIVRIYLHGIAQR